MTMPPTEPSEANDIAPELLQGLGEIVVTWVQIESVLSDFLVFLLDANPTTGFILSPLVTGSNLTTALRTLSRLRISEEDGLFDVLELLDRLDEARMERNELVHGVWHTDRTVDGTALVLTIKWDRGDVAKHRLVTADDLVELGLTIKADRAQLLDLASTFGFPRIGR